MKLFLVKILLFLIVIYGSFIIGPCQQNIKVKVYYGSTCPFCRRIILEQVYPAFQALHSVMDLNLVPGGSIYKELNEKGKPVYASYRGMDEINGDKLQACILELLDDETELKFISCLYKYYFASGSGPLCAKRLKVQKKWPSIVKCYSTPLGIKLLGKYVEQYNRMLPTFGIGVPVTIFNDKYNETLDLMARQSMIGTVCQLLKQPPICHNLKGANFTFTLRKKYRKL